MKYPFLILCLLAVLPGHAVLAENTPASDADKAVKSADLAPKSAEETEEEPDCE
jgi:hypothetical protein